MKTRTMIFTIILFLQSILVAEDKMEIHIFGGIAEPGLKVVEKDSGLVALIYKAGGITHGCPAHCVIKEKTEDTTKLKEVDAFNLVMDELPDIALKENQIVFVMEHVIPHLDRSEIKKFNEMLPKYLKKQESIKTELSTTFRAPRSTP